MILFGYMLHVCAMPKFSMFQVWCWTYRRLPWQRYGSVRLAKRFMGLQNRNDTYNVWYCIHILVKPDFCDKSHTQQHNEYKHIFVDKKEHQFAGLLFDA